MGNNPLNTYIESRRILGKPTPAANWTDARATSGKATPMANLLGYNPQVTPNAGTAGPCPQGMRRAPNGDCIPDYTSQIANSRRDACINAHKANVWVPGPSGALNPNDGFCDTSGQAKEDALPDDPYKVPGAEGGPGFIDQSKYENWTPQDQTPLPWVTMGPYADAFANMLNTPAFGGQTLEELENARIQAMKAGSAESYNKMADDVTQRLNQEAAARGMFSSGARMQNIGEQLGDLQTRRYNEEMAQEAAIRGERPQLLLQERQQRADIANMWGSMDINAQGQNLDGALQGRLMEYDRQFKNGQLSLDAFQGNTNLLGLFLDYQVSRARTNSDLALVRAQIDQIYGQLDETQRANLFDIIQGLMGAAGSAFGRG